MNRTKNHTRIMQAAVPILAAALKQDCPSSQAVDMARDLAVRVVEACEDPAHDMLVASAVAHMMPMSDDMADLQIRRCAAAVRLLDIDLRVLT